jgi:hypothetical protein
LFEHFVVETGLNSAYGTRDTAARTENVCTYTGTGNGTGAAAAIRSISRREIDIVTIVPYEFCVDEA